MATREKPETDVNQETTSKNETDAELWITNPLPRGPVMVCSLTDNMWAPGGPAGVPAPQGALGSLHPNQDG